MKILISIFFISIATLAFSQSNLTLPDSLINREFKPISLHLKEVRINDKFNESWAIDPLLFSVSNNGAHFGVQKGTYNSSRINVLNPYGTIDPLQSLVFGAANYLFNK